jgi:hypothetical protein
MFQYRLLGVLFFIWAVIAFYATSKAGVPPLVVFLVSPGSVLGTHVVPQYGEVMARPSESTLAINIVYYFAIFWLLFGRGRD